MHNLLPVAAYLPHDAPMVLLDTVIDVDDERAHCQVTLTRDGVLAPFFNADGELPAWFGIEIMAQTIGVWSGWHKQQHQAESCQGKKPRPGMLLGGRGYRCKQERFPAGATLDVHIRLLMRDEKIGSFDGDILINGENYASGRLNTYQPDDDELAHLLRQGNTHDA